MSKPFPSITLVTPSLNDGVFLEASLRSVISQDYPALEYIVVDGGSTDNSVDIIKRHEHALAHWRSEPDGGQYDALQNAFETSTGDVMGWLNANDLQFPWTLSTVGSIMSALPEVRWLTTLNPARWDRQGHCIGITSLAGFSREAFLDGACAPWEGGLGAAWIQQESTFWRRDLWEQAGGCVQRGLRLAGDFELWTRLYDHAELYGTPALLGGYREHARPSSRDRHLYAAEGTAALAAMRQRAAWRPRRRRDLERRLRPWRLPKLGQHLVRSRGYRTKTVLRHDPDSAEPTWVVEEGRFLGGVVLEANYVPVRGAS